MGRSRLIGTPSASTPCCHPIPPDGDRTKHIFQRVTFLNGKFAADLPGFYKITAEWKVYDSFGMRSAYIMPPGVAKKKFARDMKFKLFNAFDGIAGFDEWAPSERKKLAKDEAEKDDGDDDDDEASEDEVEAEQAGGEATTTPKKEQGSGSGDLVAAAKAAVSASKGARGQGKSKKSDGADSTPSKTTPVKRPRISHAKFKMLLNS